MHTIQKVNLPFSFLRYGTATRLQWWLTWGNIIKKILMSFAFDKTPRISFRNKLVPVREYENGAL